MGVQIVIDELAQHWKSALFDIDRILAQQDKWSAFFLAATGKTM